MPVEAACLAGTFDNDLNILSFSAGLSFIMTGSPDKFVGHSFEQVPKQ